MTKRMKLTSLLVLATALALVVLLAACGSSEKREQEALTYRGVAYDTDPSTRVRWSTELMEGEIEAIANELHASSVSIYGANVGRLVETATAALERDLHVWIQPRLFDHPRSKVLAHLARTARAAERLRQKYSDVGLNIGVESSIFVPGFVPGRWSLERIDFFKTGKVDFPLLQRRLNAFLEREVAVARANFDGEITYSAGPWEAEGIDWAQFDYVGLDYYTFHPTRKEHARELGQFRRFGRPILITEFGTNAFEGAQKLEGLGWEIVDYSGPVPVVPRGYVRNEQVQADYLARMLGIFESLELAGAYVYEFISPGTPYSRNPRFDQDLASYALVKSTPENPRDPASPYRWEPKEAFHAVAEQYEAAD